MPTERPVTDPLNGLNAQLHRPPLSLSMVRVPPTLACALPPLEVPQADASTTNAAIAARNRFRLILGTSPKDSWLVLILACSPLFLQVAIFITPPPEPDVRVNGERPSPGPPRERWRRRPAGRRPLRVRLVAGWMDRAGPPDQGEDRPPRRRPHAPRGTDARRSRVRGRCRCRLRGKRNWPRCARDHARARRAPRG